MKNIYKNHIADLFFAILSLALGILLLPVFPIGKTILDIVVALALLVYVFTYLVKKLTGSRGTILALTVVEFVVLLLVAVGLILKKFQVLPITQTCIIIGLVMWLRGAISLVKGYLITSPEARRKYSLLLFFGYIALVTLGTWFMAAPVIKDETIVIILCVLSFILFAVFLTLTIKFWPKSKKEKKQKTKPEKKNDKK